MKTVTDFISLSSKITADTDYSHKIKRCLLLERKAMTNLDSLLKSRELTLLMEVHIVKAVSFFSSHVQIWELDHKEGWALKNWCLWIVVLDKTLESPLDCREIKPVNPKGNQFLIFIGRTEAETVNTLAIWCWESAYWKNTLILGKTEGKRRRRCQRMRWLDSITDCGQEFEQTGRVKDREAWCAAGHGVAELDWT